MKHTPPLSTKLLLLALRNLLLASVTFVVVLVGGVVALKAIAKLALWAYNLVPW